MVIGTAEMVFRAEWVSSLKEKRMVCRSLIERTRHKFNVSVGETGTQEEHKLLTIGFACVTNEVRHADTMIQRIVGFMEKSTQAEIISIDTEIIS